MSFDWQFAELKAGMRLLGVSISPLWWQFAVTGGHTCGLQLSDNVALSARRYNRGR